MSSVWTARSLISAPIARAPSEKVLQAIGRSRGGLSGKLHALVANDRTALSVELTAGRAGDAPAGRDLLRRFGPVSGDPALVMDRAYHGDQTRQPARELGYRSVVPPLSYRNPSWSYDRVLYRRRNQVERFFRRLKRFRRVATRYDKLDLIFLSFVHLAMIWDALRVL